MRKTNFDGIPKYLSSIHKNIDVTIDGLEYADIPVEVFLEDIDVELPDYPWHEPYNVYYVYPYARITEDIPAEVEEGLLYSEGEMVELTDEEIGDALEEFADNAGGES